MSGRPFSVDELRNNQVVYLLDLTFAGQVHRLSSRVVHVVAGWGTLLYQGGMDTVTYWDEIGIFATSAPRRSLPVEVRLQVDVPQLLEYGHRLDRITGQYSAWMAGRTWENRLPLLTGRAEEPEWDAATGTLTLTLVDEPAGQRWTWPPPAAEVNLSTWPDAPDGNIGLPYPLPLGRPGWYRKASGFSSNVRGSSAILVKTTGGGAVPYACLIADGEVAADQVTIYDITAETTTAGKTVQTIQDGLGRTVSVVELTSGEAGSPDFDHEYAVNWNGDYGVISSSAATRDGVTNKGIRGLGDLLIWAAQRQISPVDWGSIYAQRDTLNAWSVDVGLDERCDLLEYLRDEVLTLFPMWLSGGPQGLRVGTWAPDINSGNTRFHFRASHDGYRKEQPRRERGQPPLTSVRFAKDRVDGAFRRTRILTADVTNLDTDSPSAYSRVGAQWYGASVSAIDAAALMDQDTVDDVLLKRARQLMGYDVLTYTAWPEWLARRSGATGQLTDESLNLTAVPVILRAVGWGLAEATLEFARVIDPIRLPGA